MVMSDDPYPFKLLLFLKKCIFAVLLFGGWFDDNPLRMRINHLVSFGV